MVKRGEIYMVDFNPARGSEQAGHRPALTFLSKKSPSSKQSEGGG